MERAQEEKAPRENSKRESSKRESFESFESRTGLCETCFVSPSISEFVHVSPDPTRGILLTKSRPSSTASRCKLGRPYRCVSPYSPRFTLPIVR